MFGLQFLSASLEFQLVSGHAVEPSEVFSLQDISRSQAEIG